MKSVMPVAFVLLVAAVAWVGVGGQNPAPAQPAPKAAQFEYKFLPLTNGNLAHDEKNLNELAGDGWELVTGSVYVRGGNLGSGTRLVLRRAKR